MFTALIKFHLFGKDKDKFQVGPCSGNDKLIYELIHWQVLRKKQGRYSLSDSRILNVRFGFPCQKSGCKILKPLGETHIISESIVFNSNWTCVEFSD